MLPLVTATALKYTAPQCLALLVGPHQAQGAYGDVLASGSGFVGACVLLQPKLAGGSFAGIAASGSPPRSPVRSCT